MYVFVIFLYIYLFWHHLMSYDSRWCHVMSFTRILWTFVHMNIASVTWCHSVSCDVIWYHIILFFQFLCCFQEYLTTHCQTHSPEINPTNMYYDVIWYHMTSYDIIFHICSVMSYDIRIKHKVTWCHMMSCDVIWCQMTFHYIYMGLV